MTFIHVLKHNAQPPPPHRINYNSKGRYISSGLFYYLSIDLFVLFAQSLSDHESNKTRGK